MSEYEELTREQLAARNRVPLSVVELWLKNGLYAISESGLISARPLNVNPPRRASWTGRGGIYFIGSVGFIKIGWSMDVVSRLAKIQTMNPHGAVGLGFLPCTDRIEAVCVEMELHERFKHRRHKGEWFHDDIDWQSFNKFIVEWPK